MCTHIHIHIYIIQYTVLQIPQCRNPQMSEVTSHIVTHFLLTFCPLSGTWIFLSLPPFFQHMLSQLNLNHFDLLLSFHLSGNYTTLIKQLMTSQWFFNIRFCWPFNFVHSELMEIHQLHSGVIVQLRHLYMVENQKSKGNIPFNTNNCDQMNIMVMVMVLLYSLQEAF